MSYSFRYVFCLPNGHYIETDELELTLSIDSPRIYISAANSNSPIRSQGNLALRAHGYDTEEQAHTAGHEWSLWLQAALSRRALAADFGVRTKPEGGYFMPGLRVIEESVGSPVRNERLGLHTYSDDAIPRFVDPPSARASVGINRNWIKLLVSSARESGMQFDSQQVLAYDTYRSALDQKAPEIRLVTLVTAIEMLIEPKDRDPKTQKLVETLLQVVSISDCPEQEKRSIAGSLRHLSKQSINQAGRALVEILGTRQYGDQPADRFFAGCYKTRSDIVHGNDPQPLQQDLSWRNSHLQTMVGHLLAGELLSMVSDERLEQEAQRGR